MGSGFLLSLQCSYGKKERRHYFRACPQFSMNYFSVWLSHLRSIQYTLTLLKHPGTKVWAVREGLGIHRLLYIEQYCNIDTYLIYENNRVYSAMYTSFWDRVSCIPRGSWTLMYQRLALNSWPSWLLSPSVGITGMPHCIWLSGNSTSKIIWAGNR